MAVFHLKASLGSRAGGQSARAKSDYIEREGRYEKDGEELEHKENENMPEWARDDPEKYWEAADEHERANGRLYSEVQFALPKELNEDERREAASSFAERLTGGERLSYTLAIHRGGANGENPHAHLMFSERGNDGIERNGEQWFKRHNAKAPEKGGARKSRAAKAGDWLEKTRKAWEQEANRALERAGRGERIDHRSLAERRDEAYRAGDLERAAQLSREPNVHLGPERYRAIRGGASATVQQAGRVDRINAADRGERDPDSGQVERLEREIAGVEARLKETYDRVRTAIDKRIRQAGRAIRAGAEAAARRGQQFGQLCTKVGAASERLRQATQGGSQQSDRASGRLDQATGGSFARFSETLQHLGGGRERLRTAIGRGMEVMQRDRGRDERGRGRSRGGRSHGWDIGR